METVKGQAEESQGATPVMCEDGISRRRTTGGGTRVFKSDELSKSLGLWGVPNVSIRCHW